MNPVTIATKDLEGYSPNFKSFIYRKVSFYLPIKDEILPIVIHSLKKKGEEKETHALEISLPGEDIEIIRDENLQYLFNEAKAKIKNFFKAEVKGNLTD